MRGSIVDVWAAFIETRPDLKAAFDAWTRGREMPFGYETWPAAFMGAVGLSAEDKAAWLAGQRDAITRHGQIVDADRIRVAA
jgi:hypothetical protein